MTGEYPSAPLQDHERYLAVRALLVARVVAVGGDYARPEALVLLGRRDARADGTALGADLHGGVRVRPQVVEPRGMLRIAALGRDDHHVGTILDVEQRARALDATLRTDVVQQQHRRQPRDLVSDQPVRRAVDE